MDSVFNRLDYLVTSSRRRNVMMKMVATRKWWWSQSGRWREGAARLSNPSLPLLRHTFPHQAATLFLTDMAHFSHNAACFETLFMPMWHTFCWSIDDKPMFSSEWQKFQRQLLCSSSYLPPIWRVQVNCQCLLGKLKIPIQHTMRACTVHGLDNKLMCRTLLNNKTLLQQCGTHRIAAFTILGRDGELHGQVTPRIHLSIYLRLGSQHLVQS